ncbi:34-kDa subunit of RNA polymerase III (C) [Trapelia coarctata]|nr:34-kDa subunit of RNA polymerase III (C) [Trapelia coarctata]
MATDIEDGNAAAQTTPSSPQELYNALYASCARQPEDKVFNQHDLLALGVIPNNNLNELMNCVNKLSQNKLFKTLLKDGIPCWKVVKKEEAAKYRGLGAEDAMVYAYIESSGREGIWTRTIRSRTNLHQTVMNRCLKTLENKHLIKSIQSAKFPTRKIYILATLQPSDDVTGGAFYTDNELDIPFVAELHRVAEKYIMAKSWYHPPSKGTSRKKVKKTKMSQQEAEELRRQELEDKQQQSQDSRSAMVPMPPGYTGYPNISDITRAIHSSKVSQIAMKEAEVRQLMDVLCWSGRVEKVMDGKAYRSVRYGPGVDGVQVENGLTEAPCGRCPVFDLCEEGGPVNATTCIYFQDWLNF